MPRGARPTSHPRPREPRRDASAAAAAASAAEQTGKKLRMKDLIPVKFTKARPSPVQHNPSRAGAGQGGLRALRARVRRYGAAQVPAGQEEKGRRFMCPMCKETFGPISKIIVLRPTGDAISEECYRKLVAPDGARARCAAPAAPPAPPALTRLAAGRAAGVYNGVKVRPKDAVRLERGGTGFAATQLVESSTYDALGLGNGLAQVRGQNPGPTSKFALKY